MATRVSTYPMTIYFPPTHATKLLPKSHVPAYPIKCAWDPCGKQCQTLSARQVVTVQGFEDYPRSVIHAISVVVSFKLPPE